MTASERRVKIIESEKTRWIGAEGVVITIHQDETTIHIAGRDNGGLTISDSQAVALGKILNELYPKEEHE